jgi:hypothetical protein
MGYVTDTSKIDHIEKTKQSICCFFIYVVFFCLKSKNKSSSCCENEQHIYIEIQMNRRLWHHLVNITRCFALKFGVQWNLYICTWIPKFRLRANVLMRPLRRFINESFLSKHSFLFFSIYFWLFVLEHCKWVPSIFYISELNT